MANENSVSKYFDLLSSIVLTFSIAAYPVWLYFVFFSSGTLHNPAIQADSSHNRMCDHFRRCCFLCSQCDAELLPLAP